MTLDTLFQGRALLNVELIITGILVFQHVSLVSNIAIKNISTAIELKIKKALCFFLEVIVLVIIIFLLFFLPQVLLLPPPPLLFLLLLKLLLLPLFPQELHQVGYVIGLFQGIHFRISLALAPSSY